MGGLYYDDADNLIFVLNALVSGGNPLRISLNSFHHVKIIHTTRVPREGRRRKSLSSTSNGPHLVGIQTGGGGLKLSFP